MGQFVEKRPTCVTVIGWFWIITGGLAIMSGLMSAVITHTFSGGMTEEHFAAMRKSGEDPEFIILIFQHFLEFALLQVCVAIVAVVSGINLLRLRAWARPVLEGLSWLTLLFVIGFTCFFISEVGTGFGVHKGDFMFLIMGCIVMLSYLVPLIIMISYLRGKKVRAALSQRNTEI